MTEELIYLSVVRDGDVFKVVDQHGRRVARVRAVQVSALWDEITTTAVEVLSDDDQVLNVEFQDHRLREAVPHVNRAAK